MARWHDARPAVPGELARFDPADWPGDDPVRAWSRAAIRWLAGHPGHALAPGLDDPVAVLEHACQLLPGHHAAGRASAPDAANVIPLQRR